jgi:hypothetical protein
VHSEAQSFQLPFQILQFDPGSQVRHVRIEPAVCRVTIFL